MQLVDFLRTANEGQAVSNLAASFGLTRDEAEKAIAALVPQLANSIERNTLSRGGLADLIQALGDGRHQAYLGGQVPLNDPRLRADGDAILGHLLGTKDASRSVAQRAAAESGLSSGLLRMLLPIIAGMVMGGLSKSTTGGLGDILSKMGLPGVPADRQANGQAGGRGRDGYGMPELPQMPGGGGIQLPDTGGAGSGGGFGLPLPGGSRSPTGRGTTGGWPDAGENRSGFPMPGEQSGGGGLPFPDRGGWPMPQSQPGGGSPLPLPTDIPGLPRGQSNPYEDLSDILRRGGFGGGGKSERPPTTGGTGGGVNVPGVGGSMLWNIIRSVLGNSLGFGNRGLFGWIFNFMLMRFGWPLLRALLGGLLRGGR